METFDRTGLENIPTILNQLNSLTVGEKFRYRFAAKHKDLAGSGFQLQHPNATIFLR
jgi:hypothetical protein